MEAKKLCCLSKIEKLNKKGMVGGLNEEKNLKLESELKYNRLLRIEEISWRQKSRATRLKEGDQNTKFFHSVANWRNSNNMIHRLKVEGEWAYDQGKIRDVIKQY